MRRIYFVYIIQREEWNQYQSFYTISIFLYPLKDCLVIINKNWIKRILEIVKENLKEF